jgi:hypothetical protein
MARYQSFPFQGFGKGLNLRDKPDAVSPSECIDALNVVFTDRGAIAQRNGYDNFTETALTNRVESLEPFYTTSGTKQLLAGCGTRLEAIEISSGVGKVKASLTGLTTGVWDFARFGSPNSEVAYAGNGNNTLRKWGGTEWTAPTATVDGEAEKAMPKAGSLAVWAEGGNRLIATRFATTTGGPNGKESSPSHVYFSDPGDPTSWTTTNYVQLTPGDGEAIQAAVVWRELLFVFKESRYFVFDGVGVDSEGLPEFNFRPVEAGVGMVSPRAIAVHPSGVYFMTRHGVYRTTGQEPELVSSMIEPIWSGEISSFYTGGTLAHGSITNCAMGAWEDRIYLSFPTEEANNRTLIYDPQFEWWSLTSIPASCFATFRISNSSELVFGYASGSNHIGRHSTSYTNDDGTAIESRWRSGWFDLGNPDVKKIRASKVWGSGNVFCGLGHDFGTGTGPLDLLEMSSAGTTEWDKSEWGAGEWSASPSLVLDHKRRSTRGTTFSLYFFNNVKDTEWSVHRVEHLVPEVRNPGTGKA